MTSQELAAITRVRSNRMRAAFASAGLLAITLFAAGCPEPADLENPPAGGGTGTTGGTGVTGGTGGSGVTGGTGGTGTVSCEVDCVNKLFVTNQVDCKLCHSTDIKLGGLDLQAAGYTARLKDQPAKHLDGVSVPEAPLPASAGCPTGALLINSQNPGESWLWKKINGQQAMCGVAMPNPGPIKAGDLACLKTYIECVAGKPIGAGSGGSGGGGAPAGGTGGAAAGGTGGAAGGSGGTGGT